MVEGAGLRRAKSAQFGTWPMGNLTSWQNDQAEAMPPVSNAAPIKASKTSAHSCNKSQRMVRAKRQRLVLQG